MVSISFQEYLNFKVENLKGRYITNDKIRQEIDQLRGSISSRIIGKSVKDLPIYELSFGNGKTKIMMWSQMHGNESTTTKAIFDFLHYANQNEFYIDNFKFLIIPILNPDGALAYTRLNANDVDLNRDAQDKSQPETQVLFNAYNEFQPHYCFNLHGQRTIFAAGEKGKTATLSFLAPAQDDLRSLTDNRAKAMTLIGGMFKDFQTLLKDQIGIYDDAFNINCTGDTFQSLGVPTILFEAGHYPEDYQREHTRYFVLMALLSILKHIVDYRGIDIGNYELIPMNQKSFLDVIIRNAVLSDGVTTDVGIQFEERLIENSIHFIPKVERIDDLRDYIGHKELDAARQPIEWSLNREPKVGDEIDFVIIKNEKILIKT